MNEKDQQLWTPWSLFLCGLCMGTADLIPGISGGTVAFILGFYHPLLESIKSFNWKNLSLFFTGKWGAFFQQVAWRFLLPLLVGIGSAFVLFAHLLHFLLNHPIYHIYLYSTFLGLILASSWFCLTKITKWKQSYFIGLLVGAAVAYILTGTAGHESVQKSYSTPALDIWLMGCGALAICALLLPGISGSYLLTLLGAYPIVIAALRDFISGIAHLSFDQSAFFILFSLGIGILLGISLFAVFLSWLMREYHDLSVAVLSGFMIGAMRSLWPFWSEEKGVPFAFMPSFQSFLFLNACLFALMGFVVVFSMEYFVKIKDSPN